MPRPRMPSIGVVLPALGLPFSSANSGAFCAGRCLRSPSKWSQLYSIPQDPTFVTSRPAGLDPRGNALAGYPEDLQS